MNQKDGIQKIKKNGILLVFPMDNKKEPASLWSEFFPKSKMVWEWNEDGDNRVADMWFLMKRLSSSRKVVYSKWYQGRATFFSRDLFTALICYSLAKFTKPKLSSVARELLQTLESDSPLSTKQLKAIVGLQGKRNERFYNHGMKQLFSQFLIVAFGEVDDGAFPSLAVGATRSLFEDLVVEAQNIAISEAQEIINRHMPTGSLVRKYLDKHMESPAVIS